MKNLSMAMVWGVVANFVSVFFFGISHETYDIIFCIFWGIVGINVLGLLLIASGKLKCGALVLMISSFVFVPVGLIAASGAMKLLLKLEQNSLEGQG